MSNRKQIQEEIEDILSGAWGPKLANKIAISVGTERALAWGSADISINIFKQVIAQLDGLYDEDPVLIGNANWNNLSLFKFHDTIHTATLSYREVPVFVSFKDGQIVTQIFEPCDTNIMLDINDNVIYFQYEMEDGGKEYIVTLDITNPEDPIYSIKEDSVGAKEKLLDFPWIESGSPFIPVVFYKMKRSQKTWTTEEWVSLISATYSIAQSWTYWGHVLSNASWAQRYMIDVELSGLQPQDITTPRVESVATDPASILVFKTPEGKTGSVGSLSIPADPLQIASAIKMQTAAILSNLSVGSIQIEQAESGIAIKLKREDLAKQRAAIRKSAKDCDMRYVKICDSLLKMYGINMGALPTDIEYSKGSLSIEDEIAEIELELKRAQLKKELAQFN